MAYRPHPKGASVNPSAPRAWATCDRTGFVVNQNKMGWQNEWAGPSLINTGALVRPQSLDKPQQQLRTVNIPPDPRPIMNARVENYTIDEANPVTTQISVNAASGATTIFVDDVTGFSVADRIYVYLDNGGFALVTIGAISTGANSMDITPGLISASSINRLVTSTASDTL